MHSSTSLIAKLKLKNVGISENEMQKVEISASHLNAIPVAYNYNYCGGSM
jgi:hypothetical protein